MNLSYYNNIDCPTISSQWLKFSEAQRIDLILTSIQENTSYRNNINIVQALNNGYVIVSLKESLNAGDRGTLLLDFESFLKEKLDQGITIWLEPLKDKSSLRKLRGIEVKLE